MKRFWKVVTASATADGWSVELDGRPVRTPAKALLLLPTEKLSDAVTREWTDVQETIDPRAMPLTGLANAAIDRIGPDPRCFAQDLAKYAEADLACYRAEGPAALLDRQEEAWDRLLAWARSRYDVEFRTTSGLIHVPQPQQTVRRLSEALFALDAYRLAGLSPLVTIGGSLIAALAVIEEAWSAEDAWSAVSIDEQWQLEQWGSDAEAELALENRRRDFLAAASFLRLLDD